MAVLLMCICFCAAVWLWVSGSCFDSGRQKVFFLWVLLIFAHGSWRATCAAVWGYWLMLFAVVGLPTVVFATKMVIA